MRYPDTVILVFAKAPVHGQVNTRLIPSIGIERATSLQHELINYRISSLVEAKLARVCLFCTPDIQHAAFQQCALHNDIVLQTQVGADLGERMLHGTDWALTQYASCVLLGTDAPAVTADDVAGAIGLLRAGNDCVFKPAIDGGYVLAGHTRVIPELFHGIPWGTGHVMQQTLERLEKQNIRYRLLEPGWDIDRYEDYQRYMSGEWSGQ